MRKLIYECTRPVIIIRKQEVRVLNASLLLFSVFSMSMEGPLQMCKAYVQQYMCFMFE